MEKKEIMHCTIFDTIRDIVNFSNKENINKTNIVDILKEDKQYFFIYYK